MTRISLKLEKLHRISNGFCFRHGDLMVIADKHRAKNLPSFLGKDVNIWGLVYTSKLYVRYIKERNPILPNMDDMRLQEAIDQGVLQVTLEGLGSSLASLFHL